MGRFKKKSKMKKILGEFKSIGTYEKISGVGVVLADYILIAVFLIVPLWVIFEPEWRHIGGGISINDQITDFRYYIDEEEVAVIGILITKKIEDGTLEIPDTFLGKPVNVINLGSNKDNIKTVIIPDSVITINRLNIEGMEEVRGGANVREISQEAFGNCKSLVKVELGNKMEEIGEGAFRYCTSLKEIKLGNMVRNVKWDTFEGCESLERVELGYSVEKIYGGAFAGCVSLKEVVNTDNLLSMDKGAFSDTPWAKTEEGKAIIEKTTMEEAKSDAN